ncbi:hypothetical protein EDD11_007983 [Mortierella claussenii]|nr:hypothetical protein EDD11_007983 [Mortierella claussenii]
MPAHNHAQPDQAAWDKDHLCTPVPRRRQRTQSSQGHSRTHSPSVQLALANPMLSKSLSSSPVPIQAGGSEADQQARARHTFERNVRRYYYQLTVGCPKTNCANRLCRSSRCSPKMTKDAAAILAIQLAARPRLFFCTDCPTDPIIDMPDSPLPVMASSSSSSMSPQRKQGLSTKIMASRISAPTPSARSSSGAAASVEDFRHVKDRRLYEPNEYSKSVPSFSVSHILSPIKTTQSTAVFHNRDDSPPTAHVASPPPPPPSEHGGTPLFRSLLSVSPFSAMFSSRIPAAFSSPPPDRIIKSMSSSHGVHTHDVSHIDSPGSPTRRGKAGISFSANFLPPHRPISFSPTLASPIATLNSDSKGFPAPSISRRDVAESTTQGQPHHCDDHLEQKGVTADCTASHFSGSSISSSPSSRRSSLSDTEEARIVLPRLNLALLQQAIATYNSSKPENGPRSPELLICKGFQPAKSTTGVRPFECPEGHGRIGPSYTHIPSGGYGHAAEEDRKALRLGEDDFDGGIVLEYQTIAAGKPAFSEDESSHSENETDEGSGPRMRFSRDNGSCKESAPSPSSGSDVGDLFSHSRFGSPAPSMVSSGVCSSEGDSTFLVDSLRSVFSSPTALGSSFLARDREEKFESDDESTREGTSVGGIDLEALRECYEMMIELKPRTIFAIQVTNSIEILLARLELELETTMGNKQWTEEEMRAVIVILMNPLLFEQPYQETLLRRILLIFTSLSDRATLKQWLSSMDEEGMAQLVTLFKMYLSAHFTPRPVGANHPAICAVKALNILYDANNIGTSREQERQRRLAIKDARNGRHNVISETSSTISFKYFYSGVMEALKFKDEYQIWREGWGKSADAKVFSYFDYPFLLSPTSKSHILNLDALTQMTVHYEEACVRHALADHAQRLLPETMTASAREFQKGIREGSSPYLVLELSRARLVEEAFEQITKKHAELKKPLKVAFVDAGEEGMDQGGVTKEFFQIMVEKVFDVQFGLFKELEEGRCWWFEGIFDGSSQVELSDKDARIRLIEYELVGILVGLALYNGVILGVRFPGVIYHKLLDWKIGLDSFIESFPSLGQGLGQMLTWTDGDVYDVFMREFEISYEHLGQVSTIPLVPGGQDVPVTNKNREEYVQAYMDHYVHVHIRQEFDAFKRGFDKICGGEALKLLRPEELELLLCGNSELDMHDLEASCLYDDGYSPNHMLMQEFWEIVHEDLSVDQHKQLLVFVTGSDRVPIRGLKDLMFVIQRNGPDSDRLPTALTCFSRLLLPEYSSKEKMKERLITAIENSNGFGLV